MGSARTRDVDRWFLVWTKKTEPQETWISRTLADELKGAEPRWVKCTSNSRTSFGGKIHATCFYRGIISDLKLLPFALELYNVQAEAHSIIARRWLQHARTDYLDLRKKYYVWAIMDEISEAPAGTVFDVKWVNAFHAKFDQRPILSR
jgi:hypothetical protein